ncbi:MAG: 3'(2'),5'-bisphosphate nucleotidase CysQ [Bacteroidetes bacterium]|nr:3'(2'),5'-bisphosphate nucleotidase CysQ [Bacteroidota bacterium]
MNNGDQNLLDLAIASAKKAAEVILNVYQSGDFQTETKQDHSPLTIADRESHNIISSILAPAGLPLLSEEGKSIDFNTRTGWGRFWLVDPLDGTKEFLKRNGDFTVNIALIENGCPVLGVVCIPVTGEVYYAAKGSGSFKIDAASMVVKLPIRSGIAVEDHGLRVVASRSHLDVRTERFIATLKEPVTVSRGSSLKFLLLAEGRADVYPRFAPTMEWDTAAAQIILEEAGISVINVDDGMPLQYNKPDLLNPFFLAVPGQPQRLGDWMGKCITLKD